MPTLLQINSSVNTGSTGRIAEQIGVLAQQEGWKSFIAYGRSAGNSHSDVIRIGNKFSVYSHGLESLILDNHGRASSWSTKQFIRRIESISPDIIHLHNIHGYYINYQILFDFLSNSGIPVVWTLHDCWPFTGHCSHYSDINCQQWQKQCSKCPKSQNYPKSLFLDRSKKNFDIKRSYFNSLSNLILVPVSNWLKEEVNRSFLSDHRIFSIPNGIDINQFCPKEDTAKIRTLFGLEGKKVLLGVATAWGPRKGWDDYVALSDVLPKEYQIVMIGVTEKQSKELPPSILSIHRTESIDKLASFYSTADVILNLSDEESFGLTTVEGFACGTPSVVYNCTASPELITSETGIVVEKGDIDALCRAIKEIASKGKQCYEVKCRERAVSYYDKNKNYQNYIALYKELCQR